MPADAGPRATYPALCLCLYLANVLPTLALPEKARNRPPATIRPKRVKIGAKGMTHARLTIFQMVEGFGSRALFRRPSEK